MAYDKPELEYIWAEGGAVVEPSDTKKQLGWVAEVPPHQYENWVQRRQDQFIFHVNERGIPEWDGRTEYLGGGRSIVQGSNGGVYKSVAASGPSGVTQDPTTDTANTYWERAYPDNDDPRLENTVPNSRQVNTGDGLQGGGDLSTNRTLSVDSSVVRTSRSITAGTGLSGGGSLAANRTLSVNYGTTAGTAAQGNDSRLSDSREWTASTVSQSEAEAGTATTRRAWTAQRVRQAIVSFFNSSTTAFTRTLLGRSNAEQVRSDLQLGTAATRDVSTSEADTDTDKVMAVGAFGVGAIVNINYPLPSYDTPDCPTGMYRVAGATGTPPPDAPSDFSIAVINRFNSSDIQQLATYNVSGGSRWFFRRVTSSGVNPWQEILSSNDVIESPSDTTEGKLLTVGAFGLGGIPIILPTSFRLNNLTGTGFFQTGSDPINAWPTASSNTGDLIIQLDRNNTAAQIGFNRTTDQMWFRRRGETWHELYHTGNFNPDTKVNTTTSVSTGDGLSGGGNLSQNRTLSVDSSVVRTSRSITAGTGLSGGGNLSANRTLSITGEYTPLGVGQSWSNVSSSRNPGTNYTNTTGRPIFISISFFSTGSSDKTWELLVGGQRVMRGDTTGAEDSPLSTIVPAGSTYRLNVTGDFTIDWRELR